MDAARVMRIGVTAGVLMVAGGAGVARWARAQQEDGAATTEEKKPLAKQPASRPVSHRPGRKMAVKIPGTVNAAIQEIKREFELGKLRIESDYFTKTPNAELTADVAVALLQRPQGASPAMNGYVKWQILSALPEEIPEQYVGDLIAVYRDAPSIEPRPGMAPDQKRRLDKEARKSADEAVQNLVRRLEVEVGNIAMLNKGTFHYRDELFGRLPDTLEVLQAGLVDVYQRAAAGAAMQEALAKVCTRIGKWGQKAAPQEAQAMAAILGELRKAAVPGYYEKCRLERDNGGYFWEERRVDLNPGHRLDELIRSLSSNAKAEPDAPMRENPEGRTRDKRRN